VEAKSKVKRRRKRQRKHENADAIHETNEDYIRIDADSYGGGRKKLFAATATATQQHASRLKE